MNARRLRLWFARWLERRLGPWLVPLLLLSLSGCATVTGWFGEPKPVTASTAAPPAARKFANYVLTVEAPGELRDLLLEHLDLARFQRTEEAERLSSVELDRLSTTTPAQARALLETEGFFNAEVVLSREPGTPETVRVQVKPGPQTRVEKLSFAFSDALQTETPAARELQRNVERDWSLPVGETFSQSRWSAAKSGALARARAGGFPQASWVETAATVDAETNRAELSLVMDSGPLYRLGELRIEGLKYQSEQTVRRLAGFEPGEPYSERLLLDYQERLQKTQLFDSVSVELEADPSRYQTSAVRVRLREAPRQQATTAIGYHANTGQRVTLEHIHRLPFGLPMRSKEKLDLGRDLRAAEVEVSTHPTSDLTRNLASLQIEQDRSGEQIITNLSARLGRLRETAQDERLVYAELLRAREQQAASAVTSGAASLNIQWTRRRLDSTLLPTDGYQALLLLGGGRADSNVASNGAFGKLQFKLGYYRPLGDSWFGNARVELGQLLASDAVGIPEKLLFRAGGDESVRGYAYHGLGPLRNGLAAGGRVLGVGSIELARPLSKQLAAFWGAVFVDAGNAAADWGSFKPAVGYGVGLRWRSPVGPLRVDIARGVEVQRWRLHFSVGIAL